MVILNKKRNDKIDILIRSSSEKRKGCIDFLNLLIKMKSKSNPVLESLNFHIIGDKFLLDNNIKRLC